MMDGPQTTKGFKTIPDLIEESQEVLIHATKARIELLEDAHRLRGEGLPEAEKKPGSEPAQYPLDRIYNNLVAIDGEIEGIGLVRGEIERLLGIDPLTVGGTPPPPSAT